MAAKHMLSFRKSALHSVVETRSCSPEWGVIEKILVSGVYAKKIRSLIFLVPLPQEILASAALSEACFCG